MASKSPAERKVRYTPSGAALHALLAELGRAPAIQAARAWGGRLGLLRAVGEGSPRTVSELAREAGMARQALQRVAHDLRRAGLLAFLPNPRHRRAPRLALTERGARELAAHAAAEADRLNALARELDPRALREAAHMLRALRERLAGTRRGAARTRRATASGPRGSRSGA